MTSPIKPKFGLNMETQLQDELEIFWNTYIEEYCFYVGDVVWFFCEEHEKWETISIVDFMHKAPYTDFYKFICEVGNEPPNHPHSKPDSPL